MRKNYILLLLFFVSIICNAQKIWDGNETKVWDNGSGTEGDPYLIEEPAHLAYLSQMVREGQTYEGKYFKVTDRLDMGNHPFKPIGFYDKYTKVVDGSSDEPTEVDDSKYFKGVFDGNHKAIDNLLINYKTEQSSTGYGINSLGGIGLFSCINKPAIIRNVTIGSGSNITPDDVAVGSVIGIMEGGLVENCMNLGTVYAGKKENGNDTGGLIGIVLDGLVQYCVNYGNVTGNMPVGGIVGQLSGNSVINACANYGSITANYTNTGGIAGSIWDKATIKNCLSVGALEQKQTYSWMGEADAIVSSRDGFSFVIENCYYDNNTTKADNKSMGFATDEIKKPEFIDKLNSGDASKPFVADTENKNNGYPLLKWQVEQVSNSISKAQMTNDLLSYTLSNHQISSTSEIIVTTLLGTVIGSGNTVNVPQSGVYLVKQNGKPAIKVLVK